MPSPPQYRRFGFVDFGAMNPIITPEDDFVFVCRQGNGDNVTMTRAQIGAGGTPDPILLNDGSVGAPSYSFISAPTTGVFLSGGDLRITIGGINRWRYTGSDFQGNATGAAQLRNITATDIIPTAIPDRGNNTTGIGSAAAGQLSLIAINTELINISTIRAAIKMGSGVGQAPIIGLANINTTAIGNVGAGEDDLMTFSLPADSLSVDGKGIRITAWGLAAANANVKTIKLHFGGTELTVIGPSVINGLDWRIDGVVIRTGAATQKAIATETLDTVAPDSTLTTPAETLSGAIIVKVTGEGVANDDIIQEGMLIEHFS